MTPEQDDGAMPVQWAVAAGVLLILACAMAWLAASRPIHVSTLAADHPQIAPPDMRLDLNTASAAQLQALPRIGPAMAERIVADREANGPFTSLDDLQRVNGIGDRTVELIAPHVFVSPAQAGR